MKCPFVRTPAHGSQPVSQLSQVSPVADICYILEGTYPYVMGGVSGWMHDLIQSMPDRRVAIIAIQAHQGSSAKPVYPVPDNVVSIVDVYLDQRIVGRHANRRDTDAIRRFHRLVRNIIERGDLADFAAARELLLETRLGQQAVLESRAAWLALLANYRHMMPRTSLLQFFWTMRSIVSGLIVSMFCEIPSARLYHAISTGYAGLVGARVSIQTGRPFLITEHGIYTNERRIELHTADWLFDTDYAGFSIQAQHPEMRDLWLAAFSSFARLAYAKAQSITTLYKGNQLFQIADGAPEEKLEVIPNGVDATQLANLAMDRDGLPPCVALIGRVVPIKDIRMFIAAVAILKQAVPDVRVQLLGPDDEDPEYASECRALVTQLGVETTIEFCGRVDIKEYLPYIHVLVLTSLSEAQPLVLLEAGAAGVPSVATDVGSCRELIEGYDDDLVKGTGGRVVPCGDARAAGLAITEILQDHDLRRSMGNVMQKRVATTYNKSQIDARYRRLYDHWMGH